jgi:MFS family permease
MLRRSQNKLQLRNSGIFYGWRMLPAAGIGVFLGYGPIVVFTFGVFLKSLNQEFNWTRTQISVALSLATMVQFVSLPLIGWMVDRFGARKVIVPCLLVLGLGLSSLYFLTGNIWQFYAVFMVIGAVAGGTATMPYVTVITRWFDKRRGLALGLATGIGAGLGTFILPTLSQLLIENRGWRQAYVLLGLMIIVIALPVVALFIKENPQMMGLLPYGEQQPAPENQKEREPEVGLTRNEAVRTSTFWIMMVAFFIISVSLHGALVHLVAVLTDRGVSPRSAAFATSVFGSALLIGRLGGGPLLDRFFGPYLSACFFTLAGIGIFLLWIGSGQWLGYVAAFLMGLGVGTEQDIIPYMVSRYFGLRAFGQLYSYAFAIYTLGGMLGPLAMGFGYDTIGSYSLVLGLFLLTVVGSVGLMLKLGPYKLWELAPKPTTAAADA